MTATVPRQRVQRIRVKGWAPVPIVNIKMPRFFCKKVFDLPVLKTRGLSPTRTRTKQEATFLKTILTKQHLTAETLLLTVIVKLGQAYPPPPPPPPPPKIPLMNRLFENEPVSSWRNLYQIQICIPTCVTSSECFKDNRSVFSQMDENALRTFTSNSRKLSW